MFVAGKMDEVQPSAQLSSMSDSLHNSFEVLTAEEERAFSTISQLQNLALIEPDKTGSREVALTILGLFWWLLFIILYATHFGRCGEALSLGFTMSFPLGVATCCCFLCMFCSCASVEYGLLYTNLGKIVLPHKARVVGTIWGFEIQYLFASTVVLLTFNEQFLMHLCFLAGCTFFYVIKRCYYNLRSNRDLKIFWGASLCLLFLMDSVLIYTTYCHLGVIFTASAGAVRLFGVIKALLFAPPIVDPTQLSNTVIITPPDDTFLPQNQWNNENVMVRRASKVEKFVKIDDASIKVRVMRDREWLRVLMFVLGLLIVIVSVTLFGICISETIEPPNIKITDS